MLQMQSFMQALRPHIQALRARPREPAAPALPPFLETCPSVRSDDWCLIEQVSTRACFINVFALISALSSDPRDFGFRFALCWLCPQSLRLLLRARRIPNVEHRRCDAEDVGQNDGVASETVSRRGSVC
jgi:hypothetical protein